MRLLHDGLATEPPLPVLVQQWAASNPDGPFLVEIDGPTLSYQATLANAHRWAALYHELGIGSGDTVLSLFPPCAAGVCSWLGLASLGAIDVAANIQFRGPLLAYLLADSGAQVVVVEASLLDAVAALGEHLAHLRAVVVADTQDLEPSITLPALACPVLRATDLLATAADAPALHQSERFETACVIYTSGTTGPSKGVLVTWAQLAAMSPAAWATGAGTDEAQYVPFPLYHVVARAALCLMARHGGRVVLRRTFRLSSFWPDVRANGCTFIILAGAVMSFLWNQPPAPDDADNPMRVVLMAPVFPEHEAFAERFGVRIVTGYNMTEISTPLLFANGIPDARSAGRLREGYPHYEVRIVDEHDEQVPTGQVGELIVRTGAPWTLNAGYLGKPEATARAWQNGWFHTGDAFRCDDDGSYYFVDRMKDTIRRRGENISSFEVESIVEADPAVAECAALAQPSEHGEDEVLLLVVPAEEPWPEPGPLLARLTAALPRFMAPRYLELVHELPKTEATLRVRKAELRARGITASTYDREAHA